MKSAEEQLVELWARHHEFCGYLSEMADYGRYWEFEPELQERAHNYRVEIKRIEAEIKRLEAEK